MKWYKPDVIDLLGDISDQDCYSRWSDGRSDEFLNKVKDAERTGILPIVIDQEKDARDFYTEVRSRNPHAEIFSALGNHDIRVFEYADKKLPALLEAITPEALWDFKNLGIDYIHYGSPPKHRYGDVYAHHGMSISKHSGESVRNDIESTGVSIIRGHSHRIGQYNKTYSLTGQVLRGWEIGHMTDINSKGMSYAQNWNWQPGFAIGTIESGSTATSDGNWMHINTVQITPDFSCVIHGKSFKA
jgi:hypothetical protein